MTINLPIRQPDEDVDGYLERLVTQLEYSIAEDAGGSGLPIYGSSGKTLVDSSGVYVYRPSDGSIMVSPDIVQVDTQDIVDAAIATSKLEDSAVDEVKIADGAVTANKVTTGELITLSAQIRDAVIVSAKIGDLQVTTAKIDDLAVNDAKIANLSVGKLEAGNITANAIYLGSGTNFELDGVNRRIDIRDDNNTLRTRLGDLGSGTTNFGLNVYDSSGSLVVGASGLGLNVVNSGQIASGAVSASSGHISDLSADDITTGTMTAGTVDAGQASVINLSASNITTGTMTAGSIDASQASVINISASNITTGTMSAGVVDAGVITTGTLDFSAISRDALEVVTNELRDLNVTTPKIEDDGVTADVIDDNISFSGLTNGSWTVISSISITLATSAKLWMVAIGDAITNVSANDQVFIEARIKLDGTVVSASNRQYLVNATSSSGIISATWAVQGFDQFVSSGSHTVSLEIYASASNIDIGEGNLVVFGAFK